MKNESFNWRWLGWVHPVMPALVWLPIALGSILWGVRAGSLSGLQLAFFADAALLSWSLLEYILHRCLFHPPECWKMLDRWAQAIHGKHHDEPGHPAFALVPPVNASVILLLLVGVFSLVFYLLGVPLRNLPVFTGFFLLGYLAYEYLHLATHHRNPGTRLGRFLRRHHLRHHAQGRAGNYGVTSHFWDWLLGTWRRGA